VPVDKPPAATEASAAMNVIDLRSDTVTRPTPAMRQAMAEAETGDDYYGEDPTVNRLQEKAARLLGFEAALFVPSGTMGNEIAIRILTEPGQEALCDARTHVVQYELAGMAVLSGVAPRAVQTEDGRLTAEHVRRALKPRTLNRPEIGLVVLENTHNLGGGALTTVDETREVIAAAQEAGLHVHIDGARLWNAAVAMGVPPAALAQGADTLVVDLSKGLCCPVGALLLGSAERMARARRVRQQLGGGMRQAGVIAAPGLLALDTMIPRLAEDHANAALLGEAVGGCPGVHLAPVRTNIVAVTLESRTVPEVVAALQSRGVLAGAMDATTLRLVTHRDASRADCERAAAVISGVLG
jgi:threonine aldolase